jgi:hypothetical protein
MYVPVFCPCCGRPNDVDDAPEWLQNRFGGMYGRILLCLSTARASKRVVQMKELVDWVYADDLEGGPVHAETSIAVTITRNRKALNKVGWDILGPKKSGNGWVLVELKS